MQVWCEVMYETPEGNAHSDLNATGEVVRKEGDYRKLLHEALDEALDNMRDGNGSMFVVVNDEGAKFLPGSEED